MMPSCDQIGVPIHFHSSTTSGSASSMSLRILLRVPPRQSPSSAILFEMSSDADWPWLAPDFFMFSSVRVDSARRRPRAPTMYTAVIRWRLPAPFGSGPAMADPPSFRLRFYIPSRRRKQWSPTDFFPATDQNTSGKCVPSETVEDRLNRHDPAFLAVPVAGAHDRVERVT